MNNLLQQLRGLNSQDIGSWPIPFKLAGLLMLLLLVLAASAWFDWKPQIEEMNAAVEEETKLRDTFMTKKAMAVNLDAYKKRLADIERGFGTLLKQLPKKSEMDALLTDINQAGLSRGLQFELFKPAATETITEFYAELPVTIKVTGDFHSLGHFASDVSKLPRIVLLNDVAISMSTVKEKEGQLIMDAVAKTYRYLDEEEIAAQMKAKKDKEKQNKDAKK
ncbi:MAG: type 4a pilus biogenesis protein PilO [Burkholderiales bacterium]